MNPFSAGLVRLGLQTTELPSVAREIVRALAPHLKATARLTVRLELDTDGPSGPLPDPVVELVQAVTITAHGLELEGAPTVRAQLDRSAP
jgi:hypothetical protein